MALQNKYTQFLAHPTAEVLAADASLVYIPTVTAITESDAILKHIKAQDQQLKKKNEIILNAFETSTSLCLETETTLFFEFGAGVYLPGMDDNLLAGKTVTIVMIHIVSFSETNQIQHIRLFWDQGSLLRSVDVIGRTGRNWPLHAGADQARVITSSVKATPQPSTAPTVREPSHRQSTKRISNANTMLDLLSPPRRDYQESPKNAVAPRESAKPPPREYGELFASEADGVNGPASPTKRLSRSGQIKIGAGKNFATNRLFERDDSSTPSTPSIKTNPNKFNHFEFNGPIEVSTAKPIASKANKMTSQWDFADFSSPLKIPIRPQPKTIRHFGLDGAEDGLTAMQTDRQAVKARPDTANHFELNNTPPQTTNMNDRPGVKPWPDAPKHFTLDNTTLQGERQGQTEGSDANGMEPESDKVLGNITNVDQNRRNFAPSWEMTDNRETINKEINDENNKAKLLPEGKKKAIKLMQPSWQMYDGSPQQAKGIKIAGNGMGGRIEAPWGGESPQKVKGIKIAGNGMGGRIEAPWGGESPQKAKGINIAGNGMGGRRDGSSLWEF